MISTDKAREILGKKAEHLTNKQIEIILTSLYRLSEIIVDQVTRKATVDRNILKEKKFGGR